MKQNTLTPWSAVYLRTTRHQRFTRFAGVTSKVSALSLARDALFQSRPSLVLGWLALAIGASSQAASARQHELPRLERRASEKAQADEIARIAWTEMEMSVHCRSTIDGSNPAFVERIKAMLKDPTQFSHIATSFEPQADGYYEITMMYRVGEDPRSSVIREAHGRVRFDDCQGTLL